jgi:zinc protease
LKKLPPVPRPPLADIREIRIPRPQYRRLSNGVPMYDIRLGTQNIIRLEAVFAAGRWFESKPLAARATAWMLREGTRTRSAAEISETLDYYGATLRVEDGFDTTGLNLYCLAKHLPQLLPVFHELLTEPAFTPNELAEYVHRSKQRMLVDLEKVDVVAYRELTELLFGTEHPYGYNSTPRMYDNLRPEDLQDHFRAHYHAAHTHLFIAGKTSEPLVEMVADTFSRGLSPALSAPAPVHAFCSDIPREKHLEKKRSSQTAIRLGKKLFTKQHEDYQGMYVLNTVLGGYFGARLMSNLREEKGYTYGVYSALETMNHSGYLYVSTEVDKAFREEAIREIRHEMRRLCDEPLAAEEMAMVRNYLLGNALRAFDGPFNVSEAMRDLVVEGLDLDFYDRFVDTVRQITPQHLQDLAQRYLDPAEYTLVTVG